MNLGPLAFSVGVIALLFGLVAGQAAAGFLRKRGLADAGTALYWALGTGLLLSRVAYVAGWHQQYFAHPWSIFNLRDGGFEPVTGVVGVLLAALVIGVRRRELRKPLATGVLVGLAAWGMALLTTNQLREATRQPLPEVTLRDLGGHEVTLASLHGKPLVINLWATWCGPCRRELPMLVQAQRELPQYRFVFADQGEDAATVTAYLQRAQLAPRDVLIDAHSTISSHFAVNGYPTTLFADEHGIVRDQHMGELSRATLADRLRRIAPQPMASH